MYHNNILRCVLDLIPLISSTKPINKKWKKNYKYQSERNEQIHMLILYLTLFKKECELLNLKYKIEIHNSVSTKL